MKTRIRLTLATLILAALACSSLSTVTDRVIGSGHVAGEQRTVADFTAVELAGSADVNILLGEAQSVNVEADDNILPLIETKVTNGKLFVGTKSNVDYTTTNHVVVTVVVKSLDHVTLSGSGKVTVGDMHGTDLSVSLPGSGNINVEGSVDHLNISLAGSGMVQCNGLKAKDAIVTLAGSGTINVYASESLNATVQGSGAIHYDGNPANVTKNISGSGSITP
ncbi:MAG: head GIN domain-containing protein [Anaerolineae bacterium]